MQSRAGLTTVCTGHGWDSCGVGCEVTGPIVSSGLSWAAYRLGKECACTVMGCPGLGMD